MSLRRSLAWAFSGQFTSFAVQFVGSIIVARLLGPREIGIYAISMAAIGIVQIFATFGLAAYVVRETELTDDMLNGAFTVNALLAIALTVIIAGLSFVAGPLLGVPEAGSVLRIVAFGNLFSIATFRPSAMLQREMRFKQLSIISVTNGLMQASSTVLFAWIGASYLSPAYGSLVAGTVGTALTLFFGCNHVNFRCSLSSWRSITKFGMQMMSVSGVAMFSGRLSDLILGRLLGVAALGLYSRASSLSGQIFENLYGTATRVIFVQLSKEYREGGDWSGTFLRGFSMITAVMWPLLLGIAVLSRPAILILYGERWLPAALPLAVLMIGQFVVVGFGMNWELFVIRGETGRQARFEIARMVVGVPIFAVGCFFSLFGASLGKLADALIGLLLYYPHVRRLAEIGPYEVPTIYGRSIVLTLVAVAPSVVVMFMYNWSAHLPIAVLFSAVGLGIAFWLVAVLRMPHPLGDEIRGLWRKIFGAQRTTNQLP